MPVVRVSLALSRGQDSWTVTKGILIGRALGLEEERTQEVTRARDH